MFHRRKHEYRKQKTTTTTHSPINPHFRTSVFSFSEIPYRVLQTPIDKQQYDSSRRQGVSEYSGPSMFRTRLIRSTRFFKVKPISLCYSVIWFHLGWISKPHNSNNCPVEPFVRSDDHILRISGKTERVHNACRQKCTSSLTTGQFFFFDWASFCLRTLKSSGFFSNRVCFIFEAAFYCLQTTFSFVFVRGQTIRIQFSWLSAPDFARFVNCSARFWWRVLLSCRLTRLDLHSFTYCFGRRSVLSFGPLSFVSGQHIFCYWLRSNKRT